MEQTPMLHPEDAESGYWPAASINKEIKMQEQLFDQEELAEAHTVDLDEYFSSEELDDLQLKSVAAGINETEAEEFLKRQVVRFRRVQVSAASEETLELVSFVDINIAAISDSGYSQA